MELTNEMKEVVREVLVRAIKGDEHAQVLIDDVRAKARRLQNEGA